MKTFLITLVLSLFSILGNTQELSFFEIKTNKIEPSMISLIPVSRINPNATDKVGEVKIINQGKKIGKKISDIAKQTLIPDKIPTKIQKMSYYDIYFDKDKNIMKIIFTINKNILEYTTEKQWIDCYNQIKAIDLKNHIEIINKDNFDFSFISGSLFE